MSGDDRVTAETADADDGLWRVALGSGMSRRRYLKLLSVGGAAAVLVACGGESLPSGGGEAASPATASADAAAGGSASAEAEVPLWFKDPAPFIERPKSLEARLENMEGVITPNRFFFVRNNSTSVGLDVDAWRLSVGGDAVSTPLELSYADIRNIPSRTMVAYLECAGNHRAMFNIVNGQQASGTQWERGGVSNGEWTGVALRDVLSTAGVGADASSVLLAGLDTESPEEGFRRAMPLDKAMHPDTLLAYALNGEPLPRDHGFPLRAVVPGWVGSSWIKWLGSIDVSSQRHWTRNNTTSYVQIGDDYPPQGQAHGAVVTEQTTKSALALAWPGELPAGEHRIHGFAQSPESIARVEWSEDAGATWHQTDLTNPQVQHSWTRFEFTWNARPGQHTIMTRATDTADNTQPQQVPFNEKGYLFNQPLPHPIAVT